MASNALRSLPGHPGNAQSHVILLSRHGGTVSRHTIPAVWLFLFCLLLLGCGGCGKGLAPRDPNDPEKERKEEEKKEDFEINRPTIQPSDGTSKIYHVKPGHWTSVVQTMKANNDDFHGEIDSFPTDQRNAALPIDRTAYRMLSTRPAAMPKGQTKHFELFYYVPGQSNRNPFLHSSLRRRHGGGIVQANTELASLMKPHQFFFVVLSRVPEAYGFLKQADSLHPPYESWDQSGRRIYYHVLLPEVDRRVPLPESALAWTNIAFILWDDVDTSTLTPDQEQAMVDWLHWGGQLIVSGPRSLDSLKSSFLMPYLPATSDVTVRLDAAAMAPINDYWSLPDGKGGKLSWNVLPDSSLAGIELKEVTPGKFMKNTGELVAERRVGRGRLVVTSFPIAHPQINTWRCFDGFINGCLLRHPRRTYSTTESGEWMVTWSDFPSMREDPGLLSNVRYFSRDAATGHHLASKSISFRPDPGYESHERSGIAGWNDFSTVSNAARQALKKAAGISIPDAGFVILMLTAYLVLLVPVNWGLFHAIGRVEWAWIAAPLIAIGYAVMIVRMAQLDIGFARSRTEIAMLELHSDYERGHLTRYTALYSSLASTYEVEFDDAAALAQPFATAEDYRMVTGQSYRTVRFHRGSSSRLTGFRVDSNSTGMLHSEYFLDAGGPMRLKKDDRDRWVVTNGTDLQLHGVGVIHRRLDGGLEADWVNEFEPQVARRLSFRQVSKDESLLSQWDQDSVMPFQSEEEMSLRPLIDVARSRSHLRPGDMRLIGWTDGELPGMTIQPQSSQSVVRTLVVVHLKQGPLPDPKPDRNVRPQVSSLIEEFSDDKDEELPEGKSF